MKLNIQINVTVHWKFNFICLFITFFNSSCRRDILRLILSWKLPGKLLCITLFFTSCHWYNIVVYFTKKNAFQSTKNFRRIQWQNMLRMASECISYNLEFPKFLGEYPTLGLSPTCACGARFVPQALNSPPTL
jgi:hypothetical protein